MASATPRPAQWKISSEEGENPPAAAASASALAAALEIDGAPMTLLEEKQAGETEEQRLNCMIQSLETEIESSSTSGREGFMVPNSSEWQHHGLLDDEHQYMESPYHVDDPFKWVDMEMVSSTFGHGMGQWYMDACMDDIGLMTQFGDHANYDDGHRDYAFYYAEAPIEHELSPLWEEQVWH